MNREKWVIIPQLSSVLGSTVTADTQSVFPDRTRGLLDVSKLSDSKWCLPQVPRAASLDSWPFIMRTSAEYCESVRSHPVSIWIPGSFKKSLLNKQSSEEDYSELHTRAWLVHTGITLADLINIMTELWIGGKYDDLFCGAPYWKRLHNNRWTLISEWGWLDKLLNMYQL